MYHRAQAFTFYYVDQFSYVQWSGALCISDEVKSSLICFRRTNRVVFFQRNDALPTSKLLTWHSIRQKNRKLCLPTICGGTAVF